MYAVVATGGKQLKVETDGEAVVERLDAAVGETVTLEALCASDGGNLVVGPDAAGVKVTAEVLEHFRSDKVVVFKFKKRKGYKRLKGHRQQLTRLRITGIEVGAAPKRKAEPKKAPVKPIAVAEEKAAAPKPVAKAAPVRPAETEKPAAKAAAKPVEAAACQCEAIKADGNRCSNKCKEGSKYCGVHAKKYEA